MNRILIVSNRLPVMIERRKGSFFYRQSTGGVATGLSSLYKNRESIWTGWPGIASNRLSSEDKAEITEHLENELNCHPVFLSQRDISLYYEGFSNKTVWPLFHYFPQYVVYDRQYWRAYQNVNERFAEKVLDIMREGDLVWIHDYQLMLVPRIIRQAKPEASIGYFHHIPFPSYELFRTLPQRRELLEGLAGADLIGFHTYDYARHFLSSLHRILGYENNLGQFTEADRPVRVDTFPMGIDYDRFANAFHDPNVQKEIKNIKKRVHDYEVILSVDRLDYTKGVPQRLEAYRELLKTHPEFREKIILIMVAVPSRTRVEHYQRLKDQVDEMIGMINGEYGTIGWSPVWYLYRSLPFATLSALYNLADVCLVTPVRDGMNLVAKEYVAAKQDGGMLVLSEMTGASRELGEAIIVNPNNHEEVTDALVQALKMNEHEIIQRNQVMKSRLRRYTVDRWGREFIERLEDMKDRHLEMLTKGLAETSRQTLLLNYRRAAARLILLDYDGTLVPLQHTPEKAKPGENLLRLIRRLATVPGNEVVVISGRDRTILENWFGDLPVGLAAEHGAWIRDGEWMMMEPLSGAWKEEIYSIIERYVDRTPGSFIEEKEFSLAWHYRKTGSELGAIRVRELIDDLIYLTANFNLQILEGDKVVEIKDSGVNKGRVAMHWITKRAWDFILAAGDDRTDEDMFAVVDDRGYTLKVGFGETEARYNLKSQKEVARLLEDLVGGKGGND
ncbi:MAG TPA: bifunctional alpha,alpha-trehalose-phosphate synthase (UDP-forming)/trehalose-phosphatase [Deltaproteobacteria bacterium]|nr:bifunctional alpha,alpha-trehalose-phosphate synthase (UDP-forming)/trehalose-phosphatase [Deltaproteobacteria bacterium]